MSAVENQAVSSIAAFRAKWTDAESVEQYSKVRKKLQAAQSHLFDSHEKLDDLGVGRWITIGSEKMDDGSHHGGHHVFIGSDGKMKTGKFAGQTMGEAFGDKSFDAKAEVDALRKSGKSLVVFAKEKGYSQDERKKVFEEFARQNEEARAPKAPSPARAAAMEKFKQREDSSGTTATQSERKSTGDYLAKDPVAKVSNEQAKAGDQLGLFGETFKQQVENPEFAVKDPTKGKQQGLFDTHGHADQMDLFGDKATPDELVYKPNKLPDTLLSESESGKSESPKADFNLRDGAGKAHTTNQVLNTPDKLDRSKLNDAFKSIAPDQHEALHAHVVATRPDLAERSKELLDRHQVRKATVEDVQGESKSESTPWDQMTRKEKEKHTQERWANYFKNTLKPGDTVEVMGRPVVVRKVNQKSITTSMGSSWLFGQLSIHGVTPSEAVERLKKFEADPDQHSGRVREAIKKDVKASVVTADGLEKLLKPESLEAIKNSSHDAIGGHVEQLSKIAPGAKRSEIRSAIEEFRNKHGIERPESKSDHASVKMTINSATPHVDEIRHALDHIEAAGGGYKIINPLTGEFYPYSRFENKNQAVNAFINKQRAAASNGGEGSFVNVRGNYKSWLISHGVKESDLTGVDEAKNKREAEAKALSSKTWGLSDYKEHMNRLDRGEVTPDQHREAFANFQKNKDAIRAELKKLKKDEIEGWHHEDGMRVFSFPGKTKEHSLEAKMRDIATSFDITGASDTWSMGEDRIEKAANAVGEVTNEHLSKHSGKWKKENEERSAKRKEAEARLSDPQTAEDWKRKRILSGGYLNLSPAEQAKHDDAYARERRERQPFRPVVEKEVKQLSGDGKSLQFDLSKNFHSKRGHDIFTASPNDRVDKDSYREMESAAKKLGGWYYKKFGNTPSGFHFPNEEARNQFLSLQQGSVDRSSAVEANQAAKQESQASRLSELAESQRERAEAKLNAPRKDDTARRARIAGSVEADARKEIAQAGTLQNIAEHIESGKAVHLAQVKNRAQLQELESHLSRAKWEALRHAEKNDASYKSLSYNDRQARQSAETSESDIAHAKYPYPYLHASEAESAASKLATVPGLKMFASSLKKMATDIRSKGEDYAQIMNVGSLEKIKDALPKMRSHKDPAVRHIATRFASQFESMKRLESMDIQNSIELKAALRELHSVRQKETGPDPIKEAERKLKREKIEGFFPTPKTLIHKMLDHADIEDGHEVLEPSAGIGSIMDAVKDRHPNAKMHGIEQNFSIAEVLGLKGHSHDRGDFLEHSKKYDRIVMNPPFEHRQDEKHVQHAYDLLKPGGKMVAIMGAGAHTNDRSQGFRDWLSSVGGQVYDTPEGAFNTDEAFRKTGVNTKLVTITKPHDGEGPTSRYAGMYSPKFVRFGASDDLCLPPDRYDWNEAAHPRMPAGSSVGGQFKGTSGGRSSSKPIAGSRTRLREIPDRPDTGKHHSLHFENQKGITRMRLSDLKRAMTTLVGQAYRAGGSSDDDMWDALDKDRLQGLLDEMNQADRDSKESGGDRFSDLVNYNGIIPKAIAERLGGGSRFFDPSSLRGRWHESTPDQDEGATEETERQPGEDLPDAPAQSQSKPRISEEQFRKAFTPKPPPGVSKAKMKKLEDRIRTSISDNDGVVEAFRPLVVEAWQQLAQEANDHNQALREMTSATAKTLGETVNAAGHNFGTKTMQSLSAMVRKARNGDLDPSKKKGFDELVDKFERNYPHLLQGRGEDGLLDLLSEGIKQTPDILDEDVATRAITLAGPELFAAFDEGEAPEEFESTTNEFEHVPFAWISAVGQLSVMRYSYLKSPERYAALSNAQREAGNYKMKHISVHGLRLSVETSKGERRKPEWPPMPCDYGYIKGTRGKDGDHLDVFLGPNLSSELVVVVDQITLDGKFDEHKILIGFDSTSVAVSTYLKAYTKGWRLGPTTSMTIDQFKAWIESGSTRRKISDQVSRYASSGHELLVD